jgi:acetyltransferase
MEMPASLPTEFYPDLDAAKAVVLGALGEGREDLSEPEAKAVLAAYGVPAIASRVARDPGDAVVQARALGFPVAIKILSPDIPQPFDVGGIVLDLESPEAVRESAESMLARVTGMRPRRRVEGFIVQEMGRRLGARELFIQARVDPVFGPYVVFGRGGLSGRTTRDKAVALPPLNMSLARDLVLRTRVAASLAGTEAEPGVDIDAICLTLIQVSQLIADVDRVCAIDVNPLLADATGVLVLGARVRIDVSREPDPHRLAIRPYPRETGGVHGPQKRAQGAPAAHPPRGRAGALRILQAPVARGPALPVLRGGAGTLAHGDGQADPDRLRAGDGLHRHGPGRRGKPETLGVVRASTKPDNSSAEFAIIVRSDQKGAGLGRMLMEKMIRYCRERGTRILSGQALLENAGMQGLAHKLGFDVSKNFDEEVAEMILDLHPLTPSLPST